MDYEFFTICDKKSHVQVFTYRFIRGEQIYRFQNNEFYVKVVLNDMERAIKCHMNVKTEATDIKETNRTQLNYYFTINKLSLDILNVVIMTGIKIMKNDFIRNAIMFNLKEFKKLRFKMSNDEH